MPQILSNLKYAYVLKLIIIKSCIGLKSQMVQASQLFMLFKYGNDINMLLLNGFCISKKDKLFKVFSTECPKIYRKSVLHLLKWIHETLR